MSANPNLNPSHYKSHPSGVQCIEVTRHMSFNLGNAVKYIWRSDLKHNAIEDLEKAKWYIEDELERRNALLNLQIEEATQAHTQAQAPEALPGLTSYRVLYRTEAIRETQNNPYSFLCLARDMQHAAQICSDSNKGCLVVWVYTDECNVPQYTAALRDYEENGIPDLGAPF